MKRLFLTMYFVLDGYLYLIDKEANLVLVSK